ncbi:MAG: hypothetical protein IPN23_10390 [Elusimicrobia bacterium]|nr:hypothetical protein [Elusimicrobiota bacterium]
MDDKEHPINLPFGVHISFHYIRYLEGGEKIDFEVEPMNQSPSVISIPSAERWKAEMPDWAKDRRDVILKRLKDETKHLNWVWELY